MHSQLKQILIGLVILFPSLVNSQSKELYHANAIDSLMDVAYELEFSNPDSAIALYDEIAYMAESNEDWLRKGRTHNYRAIVFFELGDFDMALYHNQRALEFFEKSNYTIGVASIKINMGNIKLYFGDYNDAVKLYYEGIELYQQEQDTIRLMSSYLNIGTLFYQNHYLPEALNYYTQAIVWAQSYGDKTILADLHYNIGNTHFQMLQYQEYKNHLDTALMYAQSTTYAYGLVNCHNSLMRYYRQKGQGNEALDHSQLAIQYAIAYGNPYNLAETFNAAGGTYLDFGDVNLAEKYLKEAVGIAKNHNFKQLLAEAKINLSIYYAGNHDYRQAYTYLFAYTSLADSLFTIEKQKELQELDRKYQVVKKDSELKNQQLTIELKERELYRKNRIITSSSAFIVFIVITMFLTYKVQDKKKKLVNKELERLKSEREKEVIKALLEGEEKERSRIARELHDGINGNLAALKLNMTSLHNTSYNQLIDETMEDVRNLSHNLMPEVVVKFGLKEALEQFIHHAGNDKGVLIECRFVGNPGLISEEIAVNTYRIVQELVNNCLKHADATEIHIQLIVNDGQLSVAVEDNGKGFETVTETAQVNNPGIGLSNVENRISFLQGNFDIHSSTHTGTSINIEIPLKKKNT